MQTNKKPYYQPFESFRLIAPPAVALSLNGKEARYHQWLTEGVNETNSIVYQELLRLTGLIKVLKEERQIELKIKSDLKNRWMVPIVMEVMSNYREMLEMMLKYQSIDMQDPETVVKSLALESGSSEMQVTSE